MQDYKSYLTQENYTAEEVAKMLETAHSNGRFELEKENTELTTRISELRQQNINLNMKMCEADRLADREHKVDPNSHAGKMAKIMDMLENTSLYEE